MTKEISKEAAKVVSTAAFDLKLAVGEFFISIKIDNVWLAGVVSLGALSLGAFYLARKEPSENSIRRALERKILGEVDPRVTKITDGHSILVELLCRTQQSFLLFVEDFESNAVKFRLEEEFRKIGFKNDLEVIIRNREEVYERVQHIRTLGITGTCSKNLARGIEDLEEPLMKPYQAEEEEELSEAIRRSLVLQTQQPNSEETCTKSILDQKEADGGLARFSGRRQEISIPLCLPNNIKWNPSTGEIRKSTEERRSLDAIDAGLQKLRGIKGPVCVVSIAGPCRDGKSYALSKVFGQPDVFPIGHRMDPETMGIWIWIVPRKFKDRSERECTIVLLDSEGTNATTAGGVSDNQIFTLTVLLASVMIYNSKGVPKRNDLHDLEFVTKLSQRIQVRSSGASAVDTDASLFHKTFPFFIWLLRDVMTDLPPDCKYISDYFWTRVFKGPRDDQNQEVAESIMHYFSGFEAFCLPPPAYDKEVMKDSSQNNNQTKQMNPKFFSGLQEFECLLNSKITPKRSINDGEFVTGEGLAALVELYVAAINDPNGIPNIQTAWEAFVDTKCYEAIRKALQSYEKHVSTLSKRMPCDDGEILKMDSIAAEEAARVFHDETVGIALESTKTAFEELTKTTNQKLVTLRDTNKRKTMEFCVNLLSELKRQHLDPVLKRVRGKAGAEVSFREINGGCLQTEKEYKRLAIGAKDVCADAFFKFQQGLGAEMEQYKDILKNLKDYDEKLIRDRLDKAEKDKTLKEKEAQINDLTQQEPKRAEQTMKLKDQQAKELEQRRKENAAKKKALKKKIHDMERAGLNDEIGYLEKELVQATKDEKKWKHEIHHFKSHIEKLVDEKSQWQKQMQQMQTKINQMAGKDGQWRNQIIDLSEEIEDSKEELRRAQMIQPWIPPGI